jgi:hypothetical protein
MLMLDVNISGKPQHLLFHDLPLNSQRFLRGALTTSIFYATRATLRRYIQKLPETRQIIPSLSFAVHYCLSAGVSEWNIKIQAITINLRSYAMCS